MINGIPNIYIIVWIICTIAITEFLYWSWRIDPSHYNDPSFLEKCVFKTGSLVGGMFASFFVVAFGGTILGEIVKISFDQFIDGLEYFGILLAAVLGCVLLIVAYTYINVLIEKYLERRKNEK